LCMPVVNISAATAWQPLAEPTVFFAVGVGTVGGDPAEQSSGVGARAQALVRGCACDAHTHAPTHRYDSLNCHIHAHRHGRFQRPYGDPPLQPAAAAPPVAAAAGFWSRCCQSALRLTCVMCLLVVVASCCVCVCVCVCVCGGRALRLACNELACSSHCPPLTRRRANCGGRQLGPTPAQATWGQPCVLSKEEAIISAHQNALARSSVF
jgi:hypothetical protein